MWWRRIQVVAAARVVDEGAEEMRENQNRTHSKVQRALWRREMQREQYYHHLFRYQWQP